MTIPRELVGNSRLDRTRFDILTYRKPAW